LYYDAVQDEREFVFAGYFLTKLPQPGDSPIDDHIHVVLADKASGRIQHEVLAAPGFPPGVTAGSISRIARTKNELFIGTHLGPSAGITFALSRELKPEGLFYGWIASMLENDTVFFERSQVHGPTYAAELGIYDPKAQKEYSIYPPAKPD